MGCPSCTCSSGDHDDSVDGPAYLRDHRNRSEPVVGDGASEPQGAGQRSWLNVQNLHMRHLLGWDGKKFGFADVFRVSVGARHRTLATREAPESAPERRLIQTRESCQRCLAPCLFMAGSSFPVLPLIAPKRSYKKLKLDDRPIESICSCALRRENPAGWPLRACKHTR